MTLSGRSELGCGHDQWNRSEALRLIARAGRAIDASRHRSGLARAVTKTLVPDFADACQIEVGTTRWRAFVDTHGSVQRDCSRAQPERDAGEETSWLEARATFALIRATIPGQEPGTLVVVPKRAIGADDALVVEEVARRVGRALELERAARRARAAKRDRRRLAAHLSHELRTPLASLNLYLSGLLRAARRDQLVTEPIDSTVRKLERANAQLQRVLGLIDQLLGTESGDATLFELSRTDVNLTELLASIASGFRERAALLECTIRVEGDESVVGRWDRDLVTRALTNLLMNAVEHGGRQTIEVLATRGRRGARCVVRVPAWTIPPPDQAELLRDAPELSPEGMGLWIARRIVEAHGGRLSIRSAPGRGAEFRLLLPPSRGRGLP